MANKKIRQEIVVSNRLIEPVETSTPSDGLIGERVKIDKALYNGASFHLEALGMPPDVSVNTRVAAFNADDDSSISSLTFNWDLEIWERVRSADFLSNLNDDGEIYFYVYADAGGSYTPLIQGIKFVILQDAAEITDTQTQIEVGAYEVWEDVATAETYYPLAELKIWKYEASKWDPTPTFTFGFTASNENDKDTTRIALQQASDAAFTSNVSIVTNSIVSFTSEDAAYYESSAFTPTDGYYYRVVYTNDDTMYGGTIYNAKVIATQTDETAITKLQASYQMIYEGSVIGYDGGVFECFNYYDPSEWNDGADGLPTFYNEGAGDGSGEISILGGRFIQQCFNWDDGNFQASLSIYGGDGDGVYEAAGVSFKTPAENGLDLKYVQLSEVGKSGSPTDGVYCELAATIDGATIATTDTISYADWLNSDSVVFTFSSAQSLTEDTTYYLRFLRTGSRDITNYYDIKGDWDHTWCANHDAYWKDTGVWEIPDAYCDELGFALFDDTYTIEDITNSKISISSNLTRGSAMTMPTSAKDILSYGREIANL
jgi:hypothetical protein